MKKLLFIVMVVCLVPASWGQYVAFDQLTQKGHSVKREQVTGYAPGTYEMMKNSLLQSAKYVRLNERRQVPSDMAEVILEAHNVFGTSTVGFQMLLDADHSAYNYLFFEGSYVYFGTYDDFEYKIPENADPSPNSTNIVGDGEVSILIPAGVYDYMIVSPDVDAGTLVFSHGDYAMYDDFEFQGGCTYRFQVVYRDGELGYYDYVDLYCNVDAALTSIELPPNGMDLTSAEDIAVNVQNWGMSDITGFNLSYQVNNGEIVTETCTETVAPGASLRYVFNTKADFSVETLYNVTAWVTLEGDMLPRNDTIVGLCKHIGVTQLPYSYDFSARGPENFEFDWSAEDGDGDGNKWTYTEWVAGSDGMMGVAGCSGSLLATNNDNLISVPLYFNAGDNNLTFETRCVNGNNTELLDVRYGSTTNVSEMEVIGDYAVSNTDWRMQVINFSVAEAGVYYVAFHAKSVKSMNVFIDNVNINAGYYEIAPKLEVEKVVLPYSNCDLSDQSRIGAVIVNKGTGASSNFTLTYTINGDIVESQNFTEEIAPFESATVYFDATADFSEVGEYEVLVEVSTGTEVEHANYAVVNNYAPETSLPVTTFFYSGVNYDEYWTEMTPGTWILDTFMGNFSTSVSGVENGLLSHCFALSHPLRVNLVYGNSSFGEASSFYVAFGKAGADVSTYEVVYEDLAVPNSNQVEFTVPIEEPGNYSIMIVVTTPQDARANFLLYQCTLSEVLDRDLKLSSIDAPASLYTPSDQLQGEGVFYAEVVNRGAQDMTGVKAMLYNGETLLGTTEEGMNVAASDTVMVPVKVAMPSAAIGETLNLSMKVQSDEPDQYEEDNFLNLQAIHVTDTVRATENITDFTTGTGNWGATLFVGNVYNLAVADTLTSVSVGLAGGDSSVELNRIGIAIYKVEADGKTLGMQLYSKTMNRGLGGGFTNIEFDPMILQPGKYFFEVQQLETSNMGLCVDAESPDNYCYENVNGVLVLTTGVTLAIRANFAHGAAVYAVDAAVDEWIAPERKEMLYSSDETISVRVRNRGVDKADFPVVCNVNGTEYKQEVSLLPNENVEVKFEHIDLSEVGSYVVEVKTMLDGDENPGNDRLTETLVSLEEANPYVMDFESCYDFDAAGDTFNPRWWTVDRLQYATDFFWEYSYPHKGESAGFIAFNPAATVPSMVDNGFEGFYPHSGERFGAAFALAWGEHGYTASDTWLISPQLQLSTNSTLELYVKTRILEFIDAKLEQYRLLISDTDDNFDSFVVLGDDVREAPVDWTKVVVDLSAYDNKPVYVAIQYIGEYLNNVALMVDDIQITGDGIGGVDGLPTDGDVAVYYMPSERILAIEAASEISRIEVYNIQGQQVYLAANVGKCTYRVPLSGLTRGVYVARVTTPVGTVVKKFVL